MYIINLKALIKDLKRGDVNDKSFFKYFLANIIVFNLLPLAGVSPHSRLLDWYFIFNALIIASLILVLHKKYKSDNNFINHFFALNWVISCCIFVLSIFMFWLPNDNVIYDYILISVWVILMYYSFREIHNK